MKIKTAIALSCLGLALAATSNGRAQVLIIGDNYDVPANGTGFSLDNGVNSGINPPTTRLTGSAAAGLRYYQYTGQKADNLHFVTNNQFQVSRGKNSSTITLGPGTGAYDFSVPLRTPNATPELPSVYEIRIKMASTTRPGNQRLNFALSTELGGAGVWDFGIQVTRPGQIDSVQQENYEVYRRVDAGSSGTTDLNTIFTNMADGTYESELSFLIKVTDAGTETDTYNSRVQVSMDDGATWVYDTATDPELPNGFRFDTTGRYFFWDIASFGRGTYDDFSVTLISGPEPSVTRTWTGGGADDNWSTGANWQNGEAPVSGDKLIFGGSTRQANYNNLDSLLVPWIALNNGGFNLSGNTLTLSSAITNATGTNTLSLSAAWASESAKTWSLAPESELVLAGPVTIDTDGNHTIRGGGTLRVSNALAIGGASTANPAFEVGDGRMIFDGPSASFSSRGGYRLGVSGAGTTVAETILTNGANFYQSLPGAAFRVGDSANEVTNRLIIDNSTLTMSGGDLGVPWNGNATAEVIQSGGLVTGCDLNFSQGSGTGTGTYRISNGGILEPRQIARNNTGGSASIHFDNATLRTYLTVTEPFMSGLDVAEIQSGGLTLSATMADVTIPQAFSGAGGLTKNGGYTAVLTGANTYAGNTVVQEGSLLLPTTQTNAAAIQVSDFTTFGVIVTDPAASLTAGSLNIGNGATLNFDLTNSVNPTAPMMQVGSLSLNGTVTLNVTGGSILMTTGTVTLVQFSGLSGGGTIIQGTLPSHLNAEIVQTANSIDLVIHGVQGFRWSGATSSEWDTSTQNWINTADNSPATYVDGFKVEFADGGNSAVNVSGSVFPTAVLVNNEAQTYTMTGGGSIVSPLLRKTGTNSLTRVDGAYDQITEIQIEDGAFVAEATFDATFASTLTDSEGATGTFVKDGPAVLTVTSTNSTYDGAIVVRDGVYKLGATGALGSTNGTVTIEEGATLDVNNLQSPHVPVVVSGAGFNGQGAIINSATAGGVQNNLTDVEMVGDTTFACATGGRWDIRVRNGTGPGPGLRGNGFNLTKIGGGGLSISAQRHTYGGLPVPYWEMNLGDILVSEGSIAFEESISLGNPEKSIVLMPGTSMNLFDLGATNPILRNITITDASLTCGGKTIDTNMINGAVFMTGQIGVRPNNANYFFNGPMSGEASLTIGANPNPGVVFLNAANTFTGDTTVSDSTLSGSGSLAGNLIVTSGGLAPGWGVGTFTVNGNASLGGNTVMELSPGQAPSNDQLSVGGTLTFGGTLTVVLAEGALAPQGGEIYHLFNKGGSGAFTSISLPDISGLPGGLSWNVDNLAVDGTISVNGTSVPPTIDTVSVSDGSFVFGGSGGPEGGTYHIVTSTNVAAPIETWIPVATNVFGPGGTFTFTNAIGAEGEAFFQLVIPGQ